MAGRRRIERGAAGGVVLRLPTEERVLLRQLAGDLRSQLDVASEGSDLRRLFPPAYEEERDEAAYRELMGGELLAGRREALDALVETLDEAQLTAAEADAWLRALNDLRLVLGTRVDVTEETFLDELRPEDPRTPDLAVYAYLTWLQEQLVEALAAG